MLRLRSRSGGKHRNRPHEGPFPQNGPSLGEKASRCALYLARIAVYLYPHSGATSDHVPDRPSHVQRPAPRQLGPRLGRIQPSVLCH
jgi:hypothetical protein